MIWANADEKCRFVTRATWHAQNAIDESIKIPVVANVGGAVAIVKGLGELAAGVVAPLFTTDEFHFFQSGLSNIKNGVLAQVWVQAVTDKPTAGNSVPDCFGYVP